MQIFLQCIFSLVSAFLGLCSGFLLAYDKKHHERWVTNLENALCYLQNFWAGTNDLVLSIQDQEGIGMTEEKFIEGRIAESWIAKIQEIRTNHYNVDNCFERMEVYGDREKVLVMQKNCATWRSELTSHMRNLESSLKQTIEQIGRNRTMRSMRSDIPTSKDWPIDLSVYAVELRKNWCKVNNEPYHGCKSGIIGLRSAYRSDFLLLLARAKHAVLSFLGLS